MPSDDPFPVESFGHRVRETILEEFGGRCPSMSEVASIPESYLLQLPGFGRSTVEKFRCVIQGVQDDADSVAAWSSVRLQSEHHRLLSKLINLQDKLNRQQQELRFQLDEIRAELRLRGLHPK